MHTPQSRPLGIAAALLAIHLAAPAQQPDRGQPPIDLARALTPTSPLLTELDGGLWGFGQRYKAEFRAQDVEFTPALGNLAPHNMTVGLALRSVGRGATETTVSPATRSHAGNQVVYRRAEVAERYDVRLEGLEQSFVFDQLPAGEGDLVVRATMTTEFVVAPHGDGLALELPGKGRLYIGGVTAIDARGHRSAGSIDYVDGQLELRVPTTFVDEAALPLVVDPLIGGTFDALAPTFNDVDIAPDVAYDASNGVYLVVCERIWSLLDHDIHAQLIDSSGALVGNRIFLENTGAFDSRHCRVANVSTTDSFVVVWHETGAQDIKARIVDADTGALNPAGDLLVAGGADVEVTPDVGGESSFDDDAIVTWVNTTTGELMAAQVQTNSETVIDRTTLFANPSQPPGDPQISNGNGETGYHMVTYTRDFGTDRDVYAVLIDRNITISSGQLALESTLSLDDEKDVAVDGDGRTWITAWATEEPSTPGSYDIYCRSYTLDLSGAPGDAARALSGTIPVTTNTNDDEYATAVIWTGGSTLIAWSDVDGSVTNTYMRSFDPLSCELCETTGLSQISVGLNGGDDIRLRGCSKASAGVLGSSEALLVWENLPTTTGSTQDVVAQRWESVDGEVLPIGGGCGAAGQGYATCARNGNANFAMRLVSQQPFAPAVLVVSRQTTNIFCGSCKLIPDPYAGWITPVMTDGNSRTEVNLPIPAGAALAGVDFYAQWLVSEPLNPGCFLFTSDLTDAFAIRVQ